MYDTEESPLSTLYVVRLDPNAREGRLWFRNEPGTVCTMNPQGGGCRRWDETSTPTGASPNSSVDAQRRGTGRTLS